MSEELRDIINKNFANIRNTPSLLRSMFFKQPVIRLEEVFTRDYAQPLRVGVIFNQSLDSGGGYQQALNAVRQTITLATELCTFKYFSTSDAGQLALRAEGVSAILIKPSWLDRLKIRLRASLLIRRAFENRFLSRLSAGLDAQLEREGVDFVYFVAPSLLTYALTRHSFAITVWDLCHQTGAHFPEAGANLEAEMRDDYLRSALSRSSLVVTNSESIKLRLERSFGLPEEKVIVIAFEAGGAIRTEACDPTVARDLLDKRGITSPYVFYPAQIWPHKNHIYILKTIKLLEHHFGHRVAAVFAGSDKGNALYLREYAKALGIEGRIHFLGLVDDSLIYILYKNALALFMPTYFGPTNVPPLEAFELGVCVLYPSDPDFDQQVGEASIRIDLQSPMTSARAIALILEDSGFRDRHILLGKEQARKIALSQRNSELIAFFERFRHVRDCWPRTNNVNKGRLRKTC